MSCGEVYTPFTITNHTGLPLHYARAHTGEEGEATLLPPKESQPFHFWPELEDRPLLCSPGGPPKLSLSIWVGGWRRVGEVSIDRSGRKLLEMESLKKAGGEAFQLPFSLTLPSPSTPLPVGLVARSNPPLFSPLHPCTMRCARCPLPACESFLPPLLSPPPSLPSLTPQPVP